MSEIGAIKYLTVEDIVDLNRATIEAHGGTFGIRDQGLLESAAAMPAQYVFGQELHQKMGDKAAAYLFHLCQNHPFEDGNKRTGMLAMSRFLETNGYEVGLTNDQIQDLTLGVAEGKIQKDDIPKKVLVFQKEPAQQQTIHPEQEPENEHEP